MNKMPIILGYFALILVAFVAVVLIILFRPDATATLVATITTFLGLASTGAVTFYMLNEQGKKIEQVAVQTNGNLSREKEEKADLQAKLDEAHRQLLQVVSSAPPAVPPGSPGV